MCKCWIRGSCLSVLLPSRWKIRVTRHITISPTLGTTNTGDDENEENDDIGDIGDVDDSDDDFDSDEGNNLVRTWIIDLSFCFWDDGWMRFI